MLRILVYLIILGVILYGLFFLLDRRAAGGDLTPADRGPVGPDDDEEFLRGLDRQSQADPSVTGPAADAGIDDQLDETDATHQEPTEEPEPSSDPEHRPDER